MKGINRDTLIAITNRLFDIHNSLRKQVTLIQICCNDAHTLSSISNLEGFLCKELMTLQIDVNKIIKENPKEDVL